MLIKSKAANTTESVLAIPVNIFMSFRISHAPLQAGWTLCTTVVQVYIGVRRPVKVEEMSGAAILAGTTS